MRPTKAQAGVIMSRVHAVLLLAGPPKRLEDICQKQHVCPAVQIAVVTQSLAPKGLPDLLRMGVVLVTDMRISELAVEDLLRGGGGGSLGSVNRSKVSTHPSSIGALVFLCWARVGLLSGKPLAGSPQPACQGRLAGNWALSMKRSCPKEKEIYSVLLGIQLTLPSTFEMACISRWES